MCASSARELGFGEKAAQHTGFSEKTPEGTQEQSGATCEGISGENAGNRLLKERKNRQRASGDTSGGRAWIPRETGKQIQSL